MPEGQRRGALAIHGQLLDQPYDVLERAGSEAFSSWMGVCPDNRVSGGKVLKAKTRKVRSRLARALRLGVFGLSKSDTKMGQYSRRIKGRLGKAEGLTAGAHKLGRIIYGMILNQTEYDEETAFKTTPSGLARQRQNLEKQAAARRSAVASGGGWFEAM